MARTLIGPVPDHQSIPTAVMPPHLRHLQLNTCAATQFAATYRTAPTTPGFTIRQHSNRNENAPIPWHKKASAHCSLVNIPATTHRQHRERKKLTQI
jgi:hypothetical protein